MTRVPDHLDHLADALSEDIVAAPAEQLVAEAAEDAGDGAAVAAAFDRVAMRATRQAGRRRLVQRIREVVSGLMPRRSWRPAFAVAAGLAVIVVAGDLYLHVQPQHQLASNPVASAARDPVVAQERFIQGHLRAGPAAEAPPAAPPASEPSAAAVSPPAAAEQAAGSADFVPAPARSQPAASEDRLRSLLNGEQAGADTQRKVAKRQAAPAAAVQDATRLPAAPLSFVWPLRGRLIAHFGPTAGGVRNDGVDIAAPAGSDVHAAEDGVVVYAGDDIKSFGNLILVRHRDDFVTAYAYAGQLLVKRDDAVRRGQVIAKSGRGGAAAQPMLHFEMRKDTAPVDPALYLPPEGPSTSAR